MFGKPAAADEIESVLMNAASAQLAAPVKRRARAHAARIPERAEGIVAW